MFAMPRPQLFISTNLLFFLLLVVTSPAQADEFDSAAGSHSLWFTADYLLLWTNGNPFPPLLTTDTASVPRNQAGVLGQFSDS